ncbi:MAG TPA: hypothetical protein VJ203_07830 [Bacteroidales bacterium]|nr:hypothetical protein [Bacteroidales bacterium]
MISGSIPYNLLKYFPACLLALWVSIMPAQEVQVRAELDTNRALIGDQLRLKLSVDKTTRLDVVFPMLGDSLTSSIEVISKSAIDTVQISSGRVKLSQEVLITLFDTGFFEIPPLDFAVRLGSLHDTIATLPVYVEILPMQLDSTIRDIRANYKAPVNFSELWPFILGAVLTGLLIWWLVRYFKRRTAAVPETRPVVPDELPEVIALRELQQMKEEKTWQRAGVKSFYIRHTGIIRTYIERRFNIAAMEQTTDEIIGSLKGTSCNGNDRNLLSGMLTLADMVKFAKAIPEQDENARQVDLAIDFVRNTSNTGESHE